MPGDVMQLQPQDFSPGGLSHWLATQLGLSSPRAPRRITKVAIVVLVTWLPLLVLSWLGGHATGESVRFPFLRDLDVFARYLFALPMLELGSVLVAALLPVQMQHFERLKLVPESATASFGAALGEFARGRDSKLAEVTCLTIAIAFPLATRLGLGYSVGESSWELVDSKITWAGWWHLLVSLPFLFFFLLRRVWIFLIWSWFLFRVSRIQLNLIATHPDRSAGLGFIARGQVAFSLYLMAFSAIVSAGFGEEILNRGQSLDDLKYHVALFAILALAVLHAPLLAFASQLVSNRHRGLLAFSHLVFRYDRAFDRKWCEEDGEHDRPDILGNADIQSFADVATGYEHVKDMWPFPFDLKAFAVLALTALLPMIPLLGTTIPLREILMKLGELVI